MATLQDALKQAYANPPMGHVPPAATGAVDPNMALEPKGVKPVNPLKLTPGTTGIPESPEWTTSKGFAAAGPNTGPQVAMGSPNAGPQVGMGAPNQGPQVGMGSPNQGPHMSHMGGPNVGPQSGMGPNAGPQAPTMEGVRNPNVAKGAFSAEGAQFAQSQAPQAGGGGGRPGVIDMASGGGSGKGAAFDAGNKVGEFFRNPVVKGAGKVLAVADAAGQAGDALDNFAQGNNVMGGYHAGRAGVATAAGMGNPLAIAASTGLFVGDRIYNNISDNMQNTIGSGVNSLVRGTGKIFGQDWGVDPQQAAGGSGQPSAAGKPGSAVIPTSPDGGIPLGPQNSLRALENRIPMLRNGEVAKGDRKTVPLPPNYEPGAEKVDGVYGKDIGGGIKKFDRPGQSPLYTNMEGPGAGFENRREVTPQNAAAMNALAGRYENQQRQAAQAQLAREQAGPGPQVSIMNSGMRGNMRINDNGDKGQSIADMVKTLKSNGIKVSHNTLRTMLANQGQREAAQIQANASMYGHDSSSRTQLATNANTVNAQREGNQLQNQASMHGHNVSASGNRLRAQIDGMKFQADQHWKGLENQRAGETHASAQAKGRADNASSLLESLAVVDGKDGKKFNEGQHKQNMAIANSAVPGFANMTREEQQQHMPTVLGAIQVIQGANANKEDTWGKKLGWTPVAPDRTTMPNFKPGTQLQRDGMVDAMGPSAMHDFRAGGVPLGQNLDANAIEALKRAGVNVGIKGAY